MATLEALRDALRLDLGNFPEEALANDLLDRSIARALSFLNLEMQTGYTQDGSGDIAGISAIHQELLLLKAGEFVCSAMVAVNIPGAIDFESGDKKVDMKDLPNHWRRLAAERKAAFKELIEVHSPLNKTPDLTPMLYEYDQIDRDNYDDYK